MVTETLSVQVVFALPSDVWRADLQLHPGATVYQALLASGYAQQFPDRPISALRVGIYGQECSQDRELAQGDRVEIYRPLDFDPMESRRRRAAHRQAFMTKPRNAPRQRKKPPSDAPA